MCNYSSIMMCEVKGVFVLKRKNADGVSIGAMIFFL